MGQYHVLVNVDKKEIVVPHGIGLGLKQWEHLYGSGGTLSDVLYVLMMTSPRRGGGDLPLSSISGRWIGDRCLVWGDYTEQDDLKSDLALRYTEIMGAAFGDEVIEGWADITDIVAPELETLFGIKVTMDGQSAWRGREYTEDSDFKPT